MRWLGWVLHNRPDAGCGAGSLTEQGRSDSPGAGAVGHAGGSVGDAAGGSVGDAAAEVEEEELGCSWHTVSKEVNRWEEALLKADRTGWG